MKKPVGPRRSHRGFALVELLIVLLVLGILAALLYPTVPRPGSDGFDLVKKNNEKQLNADLLALYEASVDTTQYADAVAAINALKAGISVPPAVAGGQVRVVKIDFDVNPAAYTFTPATATSPAVFTAQLGHRNVRP